MPRYAYRRRSRRPWYDSYPYYPRRRRGCLASLRRLFLTILIVFLILLGGIVAFFVGILIASHFAAFVHILIVAALVAAVLAVLVILYTAVRIITATSNRISAASAARSKAKIERERARIERERVYQARVHVQSQQAKLAREDYAFYQNYELGAYQSPRRTRVLHNEGSGDDQLPTQRAANAFQPERSSQTPAQHGDVQQPPSSPSELEALGMPAKGLLFYYHQYRHLLKPGQLIVGIRKDGTPRIADWQELKIILVLGSSASGKSMTVLEKCTCIVEMGGLLNICDPGGSKPDSLTARLGPLAQALMPGTIVALEHEDIMRNVKAFRQTLERRRRGADMTVPLLLVVDELNGLLMDKTIKKELTELIELFAQQARGYNMYMVLCAQRSTGLAAIRNSIISFICHKCPEMESAKILPARYAKYSSELGIGQTFVSDANGSIEPLQQTLITPQDLTLVRIPHQGTTTVTFHRRPTEPLPPRSSTRRYGAPALRQGKLILSNPALSPEQRHIVATWKDNELIHLSEDEETLPTETFTTASATEGQEQAGPHAVASPQSAPPDPLARLAHLRKQKNGSQPEYNRLYRQEKMQEKVKEDQREKRKE